MSQFITVPVSVLDTAVSFANIASQTTKRAMDEIGVHRTAQKRASDKVTPLLDHMVKTKVVAPAQKEAAAVMLGAHDSTLDLLKSAVDKIAMYEQELARLGGKTAADLGQGVDAATTGIAAGGSYAQAGDYNSLTSPVVGEKTANVKESDKPFLRLIGKAL